MHESGDLLVHHPTALNGNRVRAGFSLRHGGVSSPPYHSLNLGLSTGDDATNVRENRLRLFEREGLSSERLAIAGQVHGKEVLTVVDPGLYPGYDALVTSANELVLCITSADCAVVLLADAHARVVGACHSGWRGTVEQALVHTVTAMQQLGAVVERIHAYVSPCISAEHFEVGPEVAARFESRFVIEYPGRPRPHVDLKGVIEDQLMRCGLDGAAIETSPHCTFEETSDYFSYRAEQGTTGRMMGFISLV